MTSPDGTIARLPWDAADPYPFYDARRRDGEVVWDDAAQAWLALGYHAVRDVLAGPQWTSDPRANRGAAAAAEFFNSTFVEASMLFTDGPVHDRLRGAVRDVFGRAFINRLTDGVESICHETVSVIPSDLPFDAMSQIALPLPIAVIGAWLGLDCEQCSALREHSPSIIRILGGFTDREELEAGIAAAAALLTEILPAAADRRARPRDDLLSYIAADPTLSLDEVVITAILVAVAGHETTANLLGVGLIRLLTPDADGTRQSDVIDPADPAVVTELLRLDSPVQATSRTATADQTLAGVDIRCGETVGLRSGCQPGSRRLRRAAPVPSRARRAGATVLRSRSALLPGCPVGQAGDQPGPTPHSVPWARTLRHAHLARHTGDPRTADRSPPLHGVTTVRRPWGSGSDAPPIG